MSAQTPQTDAALDALAQDQRGAVHYNGWTFIEFARTLEAERDHYKALCEECDLALLDWLHQYASEECNPARVQETVRRIFEGGGTLCYIARLRKRISAALKKAQKDI